MRWLLVLGSTIAACAHGHVPMPGDLAIAHLLSWATRHPDAAQQIGPRALEWTAEHHGC
jgi:hypothetical protein